VDSRVRALSSPSPVDHSKQSLTAIRLISSHILLYTRSHLLLFRKKNTFFFFFLFLPFLVHQHSSSTMYTDLEKSLPRLSSNLRWQRPRQSQLIPKDLEVHAYNHFLFPQNWSKTQLYHKSDSSTLKLQNIRFNEKMIFNSLQTYSFYIKVILSSIFFKQ
jgi:hypothetical protein